MTAEIIRFIQRPKHDRHPRWAPDGKRIAFESNRGGSFQVYTISVEGGEAKQPTDSLPGGHLAQVAARLGEDRGALFDLLPEPLHAPCQQGYRHDGRHQEDRDRDRKRPRVGGPE